MANNIKKRNWGAVIYPESAPKDWKEILKLKGVAWACSPLHNKDVNPTGEPKKEHYHIILCYDSPTTFNNVKTLLEELNQPIPVALESVRGYYRYFTHKDNPEKYQYNEKEIEIYNAFNVDDVLNSTEVYHCMKLIQSIIHEKNIIEYCELMDYLLSSEQGDLWNVACSHTLYFNSYISSKRHKFKDELKTFRK